MTTGRKLRKLNALLAGAGLERRGLHASTGVERHLDRAHCGETTDEMLRQYATDLRAIAAVCEAVACPIPVDFWDVCTPAMEAAGETEYSVAACLARPEHEPYVRLLGRCFGHLRQFKDDGGETAVATALLMLVEAADRKSVG